MRILVTGGAGFIGSHIVDALVLEDHEVTVVDNLSTGKLENLNAAARFYNIDICDVALSSRLNSHQFDYVIHQAAHIDVRASVGNPVLDARNNILGTLNLLQVCCQSGLRGFIFASSGGAVYGEPDQLPVAETHPKRPLNPYGVSKLCVEYYLHCLARISGLPYLTLRYGNVYGPRQNAEGEAGVIAVFSRQMLEGRAPVVYGDGEQIRDYIFVHDVVRANLLALDHLEKQHFPVLSDLDIPAINIASGQGISVNELVESLRIPNSYNGPIEHSPPRPGEIHQIYLDSGKAARLLGWKAQTKLELGLRLTREHIRQHLNS